MIRVAQPLDAGAVGRILSEFIDTTDWMPRLHSRAEDISFAGTMIDRGWVRVFEEDAILGFIAQSDDEVCALYVARAARGQGVGTALLNDAKQLRQSLKLWTFQLNLQAQKFYLREGSKKFPAPMARAMKKSAGNKISLDRIADCASQKRDFF